jgi:hypothetical protein
MTWGRWAVPTLRDRNRHHRFCPMSQLLLAEGDTPTHVFEAIAREIGLSATIEIRNYGGISQLATFLKIISSTAEFRENVKSLGIVRDAEDDPIGARRSVDAAIAKAKLPNSVRTAVAILPDDHTLGMIETLCMRSVESTETNDCINRFFDCLEEKGVQTPKTIIRAKHIAQVYLATRGDAQMMPGIAAYRGAWQFANPAFDELKSFLKSL